MFAQGHPAKVLRELEYGERQKTNGTGAVVSPGNGVVKEEHGRMMIFDFLAQPENEVTRAALAAGMNTLEIMHGKQGSLDFPWERWDEEGAVIVDVSHRAIHFG